MPFIVVVINQMPKFVVELKGLWVSEPNALTILQHSAVDSVIIVNIPDPVAIIFVTYPWSFKQNIL